MTRPVGPKAVVWIRPGREIMAHSMIFSGESFSSLALMNLRWAGVKVVEKEETCGAVDSGIVLCM